jgi:hypothetical protein
MDIYSFSYDIVIHDNNLWTQALPDITYTIISDSQMLLLKNNWGFNNLHILFPPAYMTQEKGCHSISCSHLGLIDFGAVSF